MKLTLNEKEITLKQTFKAHLIYEQITGKTFTADGLTSIITFFYSTVMACDSTLSITFDEFIDNIDDNPERLRDFINFLTENNKRQTELFPKEIKEATKKETKKKK